MGEMGRYRLSIKRSKLSNWERIFLALGKTVPRPAMRRSAPCDKSVECLSCEKRDL